jgi:hypothetical protein
MQGHCLCGAIIVHAADHHEVEACHCGMCRRWSGGPLLAVQVDAGVRIDDAGGRLRVHRTSDWAERAFCGECGTHIYYHLVGTDHHALPAGLFQDADFRFDMQIFIDRKPGYYEFANRTKTMTEAEVFAKYAPGGDGDG